MTIQCGATCEACASRGPCDAAGEAVTDVTCDCGAELRRIWDVGDVECPACVPAWEIGVDGDTDGGFYHVLERAIS